MCVCANKCSPQDMQTGRAGPGCGLYKVGHLVSKHPCQVVSDHDKCLMLTLHLQMRMMDSQNMLTGKGAAAVIGLAVCGMFVIKGGETLGSTSIGYSTWRETGLLGAPARVMICITAGLFLLAGVWLYRYGKSKVP